MTHANILGTFIIVIIGYLIGSISPSIIISKKRLNSDVRDYYSHNAGATNASRVLGKQWGIIVLFADGFKPIIIVLIAWSFKFINIKTPDYTHMFKNAYIYLSGLAGIVGHCYPVYFGFRGGKGAASSLGLLLILNPIYFLVAVASWWIVLFFFRMVSLSSILMVGFAFIVSWIPNIPLTACLSIKEREFNILNIIIAITWLIVIIRHLDNIKKIIKGNERKTSLFSRKQK